MSGSQGLWDALESIVACVLQFHGHSDSPSHPPIKLTQLVTHGFSVSLRLPSIEVDLFADGNMMLEKSRPDEWQY